MNAPARIVADERAADFVEVSACESLLSDLREIDRKLKKAKSDACNLIAGEAGDDVKRLARDHRLREVYRPPPITKPAYTPQFERALIEEIDGWGKYIIRERLRLGMISRATVQELFSQLSFDPATV